MHNVQRPFNAHLLGEAVEKNWAAPHRPSRAAGETQTLRESKPSKRGAAPPQRHRRVWRDQNEAQDS